MKRKKILESSEIQVIPSIFTKKIDKFLDLSKNFEKHFVNIKLNSFFHSIYRFVCGWSEYVSSENCTLNKIDYQTCEVIPDLINKYISNTLQNDTTRLYLYKRFESVLF